MRVRDLRRSEFIEKKCRSHGAHALSKKVVPSAASSYRSLVGGFDTV